MDNTTIHVTTADAIIIPRREYDRLLASSVQLDMILASRMENGYYPDVVISAARTLRERVYDNDLPIRTDWRKDTLEGSTDA